MSQKLSIEPISDQNFDDFLFLIEKLAEYEHLKPPDETAKIRLRHDGLSDDPKYEAYLGNLNGAPVGYLIFFFNYSSFLAMPTLYIEDIFILQEHRRKGLGQQFFKFCVEIAKDRGCGRIEWCVLSWNQPAIKFYEKNNAQKLDWIFYRFDREQIEGFSIK
jgi:GNAT superfamily N-acetyltransferase